MRPCPLPDAVVVLHHRPQLSRAVVPAKAFGRSKSPTRARRVAGGAAASEGQGRRRKQGKGQRRQLDLRVTVALPDSKTNRKEFVLPHEATLRDLKVRRCRPPCHCVASGADSRARP